MIQDFIRYILDRMGLSSVKPFNSTKHIIWLDRRATGYTGRKIERQVSQESLGRLKRLLEEHQWEFEIFNPAGVPLEEQIRKVRSANIIMGVHGAALTHMVFQALNHTGIIELLPSGYSRRREPSVANIFVNLASWVQQKYASVHSQDLPHLADHTNHHILEKLTELN